MKERLIKKVDRLDASLHELLSEIRPVSHERLNQQPPSGGWSATQVMHHLMLSEQGSLMYCRKKLSYEPKLKVAGPVAHFKANLVKWYLKLPVKYQAPTGISGPALPPESTLAGIEKQWQAQRRELRQFFEELPDRHIDKVVYKHPFGGRLSFAGMLNFFEAHFERHQKQLHRAIGKEVE